MRKFIFKTALFIVPFLLLYYLTFFYYKTDRGDLLRLGYIMDDSNYLDVFNKERKQTTIYYDRISNGIKKEKKYTALVFGDSFSDGHSISGNNYVNYLSKNDSISLLLFDRGLNDNSLQMVLDISKGDVLNKINVKYIILQSVERYFVKRNKNIRLNDTLTYNSLLDRIQIYYYKTHQKSKNENKKTNKFHFFAKPTIAVALSNILYHYTDKPFCSKTYKVKTTIPLFTMKSNELLFSEEDLNNVVINNDFKAVSELNNTLNIISDNLSKKGVKLIVLPSTDKYDLYYEYITNKNEYLRPLFFEYFEDLQKKYLYLDSKKVLENRIKTIKDIHFYDDTHWSPVASKIIASELKKMILKNN